MKWLRDDHGLAAIEFALLLPAMVLLLFGMIELGFYASAIKKANTVVHTAVDLVTLEDAFTSASLEDTIESTLLILKPLDTSSANYGFRVTGLSWQYKPGGGTTTASVCRAWSRAYGDISVPELDLSTMNVTWNVLSTAIHIRFVYNYSALFSSEFTSTIDETAVAKPRTIRAISLDGGTHESSCVFP